jgi:hypothetical protein
MTWLVPGQHTILLSTYVPFEQSIAAELELDILSTSVAR